MNQTIGRQIERRKLEVEKRLEPAEGGQEPRDDGPEFRSEGIQYEVSDRVRAITAGGIGAIHKLCAHIGLVAALDKRLPILQRRRPYSEADHVLNIAFNILSGGRVLDDIESEVGRGTTFTLTFPAVP